MNSKFKNSDSSREGLRAVPKVVALSSLKRRRPNIQPSPVGIVRPKSDDTFLLAKSGPVGLDLTFDPIISRPIKLTNNGGATVSAAPVQLIFWGSDWDKATATPSVDQIVRAVLDILAGPYMSALRQYGIKCSSFGGAFVVTSPPPPFLPHTFDDGDVNDLIWELIDEGHFPEPDESGGRNLYFVMMPAFTQYGPGGAAGAHGIAWDYDLLFDYDKAYVAWIGHYGLGTMTSVFTHELAEMCTDPEGDGWTVSGQPIDTSEIGDICNNINRKLNNVLVESYWSRIDNACLIPTSFSVRRTLQWANITLNGSGLRSLQASIPSLKAFLCSL